MKKFIGTIEELKALVTRAGLDGTWSEPNNNHHRFDCKDGSILNWWDTKKKTISLQGGDEEKQHMEVCLEAALTSPDADASVIKNVIPTKTQSNDNTDKKIFVVHGHDDTSREQLERILLLLGLEPFVLMNTSGSGLTIIEALEKQIGKKAEADFGIVLLTPDDMGYAIRDGEDKAQPRARQNVILEMGMLMASLTRSKIAILEKGYVEIPSDADGILRLKFQDHVKEAVPKLTDHLRNAGFEIESHRITKAAS